MRCVLIVCFLYISAFAYADTIYFKHRNPISGKIVRETEKEVTIRLYGDTVNYAFPKESINRIEKEHDRGQDKEAAKTGFGTQETAKNVILKNPEYEIIDEQITDVPVKTQVRLAILVSGKVTKEWVSKVLHDLYDATMRRSGFKYHTHPTNVYIYAVLSKEHYEAGMGQWIAMLEKSIFDATPKTSVNERQLAQIGAKPIEKFGLSQAKRKEIWIELVRAEDRASMEADNAYPVPEAWKPSYSLSLARQQMEKQAALQKELYRKYEAEIMAKYGLAESQVSDINYEAYEKDWAFPK